MHSTSPLTLPNALPRCLNSIYFCFTVEVRGMAVEGEPSVTQQGWDVPLPCWIIPSRTVWDFGEYQIHIKGLAEWPPVSACSAGLWNPAPGTWPPSPGVKGFALSCNAGLEILKIYQGAQPWQPGSPTDNWFPCDSRVLLKKLQFILWRILQLEIN